MLFLSKWFAPTSNLLAIFYLVVLLFAVLILFFFSKWFAPSSNSVARPQRLSDKRLSGKAAGLGKHEGKQRGFENGFDHDDDNCDDG